MTTYARQHAAEWRRAGAVRVVIPSIGYDKELPQSKARVYLDGVEFIQALLEDGHSPSEALKKYARFLGIELDFVNPFSLPNYPIWHRGGVSIRHDNGLIPFLLTFTLPRSRIEDRDLYTNMEE